MSFTQITKYTNPPEFEHTEYKCASFTGSVYVESQLKRIV